MLLSQVILSTVSVLEDNSVSLDITAAPPAMIIIASMPIPIPTNFLLDFLLALGFASIYPTYFSSMPISSTDSPVFSLCLSRYSLSYFSKSLSFLVTLDGSGWVVFVSDFVIREPQLLQKLFEAEF